MILLSMAHRGEAQTFIKSLNLKAQDDSQKIFLNEEYILCLTGEGIYESLVILGDVFTRYPVSEIYNYGIAGSLSSDALPEKIYKIRTAYAYIDGPQFKSYEISSNGLDCITSSKRVLDDENAKELSHYAHIVDRELWALCKFAKYHKCEINSFKLISDIAGSSTMCFDIKEQAKAYSELMYNHFCVEIGRIEESEQFVDDIKNTKLDKIELHFSFTQKKRIQKLIELGANPEPCKDAKNANELIRMMEYQINPIEEKIDLALEKTFSCFQKANIKISTDPKREKKSFKLTCDINSAQNIEVLKKSLEDFNFSDFENVWKGNF